MRHRINKQIHSGCFFQLYLGLHEDADAPFETVSTFILAPSEIDTPDTYFQRVAAWDVGAITSHGLITVEGPEKSPKGYRSVNISCLVPYKHPEDWFVRGGDKSKYRKYKQLLADRIIDSMTSHIPRLRERIVVTETATPLTLERYTSATQGAIQGLAHTPQQSGKRRGKFKTCIEGLYRVGQYVSPGAGIAPVSISGALCAEEIMKNNR
jgi:phytoene dehydrogenase-like protein